MKLIGIGFYLQYLLHICTFLYIFSFLSCCICCWFVDEWRTWELFLLHTGWLCSAGMSSAVWRLRVLRTEWCNVLREAFSRASWHAVCRLWSAYQWSMCDGHVQEVPSGPFRLHVLLAAVEQGHIQGTEWEAVLPCVLRQTVRLNVGNWQRFLLQMFCSFCLCLFYIRVCVCWNFWYFVHWFNVEFVCLFVALCELRLCPFWCFVFV